jgi:hypothetical protein
VPAVRFDVTLQEVDVAPLTVQVPPPVLAATVYPVMVEPPLDAGTVQFTTACGDEPLAMPATTVVVAIVGAPGTVAGVTLEVADDAALLPMALLVLTVKV